MNDARQTWIARASSILLGIALWTVAAKLGHRKEPWDSPDYWTLAYPAAIAVCGVLGFLFPDRPCRWALILMFMQLPVMSLNGAGDSLLPLGVILVAVLSLPVIGLGQLGAMLRRKTLRET